MVTLKQAIKLLDMREDEIIYLRSPRQDKPPYLRYSVKQIKEKFDMKHTYVSKINPYHYLYSSDINWEFTIKQIKIRRKTI